MTTPTTVNKVMSLYEWGLLLLLSLVWGGSFFFNGVAVQSLPTFTVVWGRVVCAALILLVVLRITGQSLPKDRKAWQALFFMGLFNNVVPFSLIVWGQSHIASGVASILNATTPLFTVLVAHALTDDEKMTRGRFLGVVMGLAGVCVLIGPEALSSFGDQVLAQGAVVLAAISYAFSGTYGRRFKTLGLSPLVTATGMLSASSLMLAPIVLVAEQPWTLPFPGLETWGAILGLAAISTAYAYLLYFRLLATAGVTNLLLVTFLIPVSAILLGISFLGEVMEPKHFLGMACIGLGLAAIDGRLWQRLSLRPIFSNHK